MDIDIDVVTALTQLGGVADSAALLRMVTPRQLREARGSGQVVRLKRGLNALATVEEARVAAHRVGGAQAQLSAAMHWGWKVKSPPLRPVVIVPRHRRLREERRTGLDVRWADQSAEVWGDRVTGRVATVVACARSLPFDEALAVVDSALRSRKVTRAELLEAALASPRTGRARAVRVIEAGDARAANPFESVLRAIALEVPGLTVVPQGAVAEIGHTDLSDAALRIAIEAESWEHHGGREAFVHDVRRYTAMVRLGWLVARFVWDDVMFRSDHVRAVLIDMVELRAPAQTP